MARETNIRCDGCGETVYGHHATEIQVAIIDPHKGKEPEPKVASGDLCRHCFAIVEQTLKRSWWLKALVKWERLQQERLIGAAPEPAPEQPPVQSGAG